MKRSWKKVMIWSSAAVGVLLIGTSIYLWYLYHSVETTVAKMYEPSVKPVYVSRDPEIKRPEADGQLPVISDERTPFTVLVLGVDEREHDRGRSDTMIVLSVNPTQKSVLMFNIPRDSRTSIIGRNTVDKINHAYAFGGVEMSLQTVENFLDFPIDYYIKINMEGFARLIDLIGGVNVNNPFAFEYTGHQFEKGPLSLNGTEALLYSRMRYDDPRGDFGRNSRQRDILQSIMKNALSLSNITRIHDLLSETGNSFRTNITFDEMQTFVKDYRTDLNKIDTEEIKGQGQIINGIWYYLVEDAERNRIHDLIKNHMANKS